MVEFDDTVLNTPLDAETRAQTEVSQNSWTHRVVNTASRCVFRMLSSGAK